MGIAGDSCLVVVGVGEGRRWRSGRRGVGRRCWGGVALVPPGVRGRVGVDSGSRGLVFRLGTGPAGVPRRGG